MGAVGREILAAAVKAATWGTAASVGANTGLLLTKDSIVRKRPPIVDVSAGTPYERIADQGNIVVAGDLTAYGRYDSLTALLAMAMGTAGAPAQQGGTAAYKHILQLATNCDGKFLTYARDLVTQIQECPSMKVLGFDITGRAGEPIEITFHIACDDLLLPAVTNTSLASVTYRDRANRILFGQMVMRCNAQSGGALAGGDTIKPSEFKFSYMKPMVGDYLAGNNYKIAEPVSDSAQLPQISLTLTFPLFNSAVWNTAFQADTRQKLDMTFTGALISGSYYYSLAIICPHLMVETSEEQISGPDKIPNPVTLRLLTAAAAPTGMSYTQPFTIELINLQTTDPLA